MGTYILRRLLNLVPVLVGISLVTFVVTVVLPGDPVSLLLGQRGDLATRARLRAEYRLDDPVLVQYAGFLGRLVRGDLGRSIQYNRPVAAILCRRFVPTLQLALGAMLFAVIIGVPAGIVSARWPHSWADLFCMFGALVGVSMPVFWLGLMLIVFVARSVSWIPIGGYEAWSLRHLLLPCITLGTVPMALVARLTRSSVLDVLGRDFLRTARAKGLDEWRVVLRHALRPALVPIVTVVGTSVASLLSGAVLTETVFSIPGLGREIFDAIQGRDYPVVVGGVMWFACTFVAVNLVVDVLYGVIDPRVRLEGRG